MNEPKCETRFWRDVIIIIINSPHSQYKLSASPTPSDEEEESSDEEGDTFGPRKEKVEEDPVTSKEEVGSEVNISNTISRSETTGGDSPQGPGSGGDEFEVLVKI